MRKIKAVRPIFLELRFLAWPFATPVLPDSWHHRPRNWLGRAVEWSEGSWGNCGKTGWSYMSSLCSGLGVGTKYGKPRAVGGTAIGFLFSFP